MFEIDCAPRILELIGFYAREYADTMEGRSNEGNAVEMQGGARINHIFHDVFRKAIDSIDPFEYLTESDIQTAIKNASAMSTALFVPESAFEVLIRQQMARLLEPSLNCAYMVYEELRRVTTNVKCKEIDQYYKLKSKICDVMEGVLSTNLTPTCEMITNLFEIENAFINTSHPDFVGSADSLLNLFQAPDETLLPPHSD